MSPSQLPCRQDDSASEDGSEPPSPRHLAGPALHTPDVNGNSAADKTGDEDDPMVGGACNAVTHSASYAFCRFS